VTPFNRAPFYDTVSPALLRGATRIGVHAYPGRHEHEGLIPTGQLNTMMDQVRSARNPRDPGRALVVTETGASTTLRPTRTGT
jgi:hypothetical protein